MNQKKNDKKALIDAVELAIDYGLEVPKEDYEEYLRVTANHATISCTLNETKKVNVSNGSINDGKRISTKGEADRH